MSDVEVELCVQIERLVDHHFPGFVECVLVDAHGNRHVFVEKMPVVTTEHLASDSRYPMQGTIACQIQREWDSDDGRALAVVSTALPWDVESTEGMTTFVVSASQLRRRSAN